MSGEIVREWYFWLVSVATGAFMAFSYDVIRLFRQLVRHGRFAVDFEDILYWTACFGLSFTLLYYGNNGVIRFAAVLGAAVGMFLYVMTLGRFFVRFGVWVVDKTIGNLFRLGRKTIRALKKLLRPIKDFVMKNCHRLKMWLTRVADRHKMKLHKHRGAKDGKGEPVHVSKKRKRKKDSKRNKPKDTGVSPRQK